MYENTYSNLETLDFTYYIKTLEMLDLQCYHETWLSHSMCLLLHRKNNVVEVSKKLVPKYRS